MSYELNGRTYRRQKWDHSRSCDYCKAKGLPECKHVRGGKTAAKRASLRRSQEY